MTQTLSGQTTKHTYDDEDRLTSVTTPGGITDTFTYNGLGLRVGKTDSTGTYSYVCDGASPGSPVLSDGHAMYTPGLSQNRGGVSTYAASDVLGNLWFMDNGGGQQTYYQDTTAFGSGQNMGLGGTEAGPFKFGGANGCQTDVDTGLVLMGHRYYDTRIGRFISQDPAGAGDNWYAYAGNNPTNMKDPTGLMPMDGPGSSPSGLDTSAAMGVENMESYGQDSYSYSGYWTRGEPTGDRVSDGLPSVEHGEVVTQWVPDMTGPMVACTDYGPYRQRQPNLLEKTEKVIDDELRFYREDADYAIGAMRGPDGRFVNDPSAAKSPQFDPRKARQAWEKAKGRAWPKDPTTGQNFDVHHIKMKSQGGGLYDPK